MDKQNKIELFLDFRNKAKKRLAELEEKFKLEKENEEMWPGHENTFFINLVQEYELVKTNLKRLNERLKKLGRLELLDPYQKPKNHAKWSRPRTLKVSETEATFCSQAGEVTVSNQD